MCAGTGAHLHLVEPLGFDLTEKHLRRAGLDYHDLAEVTVHKNIDECFDSLPGRIFAFTTQAKTWHTHISFEHGDALLFGTEPTGLPREHVEHPRVSGEVRIPMLASRRSMNLSNSAAVATYEAWRQLGFPGGV